MSNINDNNLDDLLRRAAEKYPLRTDSADFGKLVADLEKDPSLILPPVNVEDRRRRRRFLWLFLLLPLGGGAYFAWHAAAGRGHTAEVAQSVAPKVGAGQETAGGESAGQKEQAVGDKGTVVGQEKATVGKEGAVAGGEGKTGDGETRVGKENVAAEGERTVSGVRKTGEGKITNGGEKKVVAGGGRNITGGTVGRVGITGSGRRGNEERGAGRGKNTMDNEEKNVGKNTTGNGENANAGAEGGETTEKWVTAKLSLASTRGPVNVNMPVKARATVASQQSTSQKDKEKTKLQKPKPSFYVGILGSPDLSTIKMQSVKTVGYNFGVLLGYSFNSRWAIETGLYYDRKKYYTDGEYFSKSKVWWLNNYNVKTVNGYCDMWEIPLNVRYNFSTGDKMKWFATVGTSTYLMSKEEYTFEGTDASGNPWGGTWPYKKPYKYWFSILNLSVGFEQRLGKIGNLRLEPFVRVPLSGMGTGSLSIMSAGLNIGITRRIW